MVGEDTAKTKKRLRGRSFVARELQLSIAVLAVMELLGGALLQTLSSAIVDYYKFGTPVVGLILIAGYIVLVILLSVFFTHRLVGPFKRVEYEMKMITAGDLSRRLSVRGSDDLHVKHFVANVNEFISGFEEMSMEYNRLNSTATGKLDEIVEELTREKFNCEAVKEEIKKLQRQIHEFRERW